MSLDFLLILLILINWKNDSNDSILSVLDYFKNIVYYKPVNFIIDIAGLVKMIINMIISYHNSLKLIINN